MCIRSLTRSWAHGGDRRRDDGCGAAPQSGQRRFILGGRDRRVSAATRLEAPDAGYGQSVDVDAWVSAADFDEILTMVSRRSGLDIRPPAPGEATRCLLFANALKMQEFGSFAFRKQWEFTRS